MNLKRKTPALDSLGPVRLYRDVIFMCLYRPDYHRKVARFLSKLRRSYRITFNPMPCQRAIRIARDGFVDVKLPFMLKWQLRGAVQEEFGFDLFGPDFETDTKKRMRFYRNSPH